MAPIVKVLQGGTHFESKVCVTAQHRAMLDQVLELFQIQPDFDLDIMTQGQDLTDVTIKILSGLKEKFRIWKPDIILVHGDTSTTLSASLAAFYHKIPVGHVEAGLRTGDISSPWPEEANRKITSVLTDWNFAPTNSARENLVREMYPLENIFVTGNTVIDALLDVSSKIDINTEMRANLEKEHSYLDPEKRIVLVTSHRRENFGGGIAEICVAIKRLVNKYSDIQVVFPVHPNPNVSVPVKEMLGDLAAVSLIEPQEYLNFVYLMKRSYFILTDSGGIQEEAPSLGKPVLVMRDNTERPEAISAGVARLVGTASESIFENACELLDNKASFTAMAKASNPYGDGNAAQRIYNALLTSSLST